MATFDDFTKKYFKSILDEIRADFNPGVDADYCKMMGYENLTDPMQIPSEELCRRMVSNDVQEYEPFEDWMWELPTRNEYYGAMFRQVLNDYDLMGYRDTLGCFVPMIARDASDEGTPLEYLTKAVSEGVENLRCFELKSEKDCLDIYADLCNELEQFRAYRLSSGDDTEETYDQYHYVFMVRYAYVQMCEILIEALYPEKAAMAKEAKAA